MLKKKEEKKQNRTKILQIRVNKEELNIINQKTKETNLTTSEYLRTTALGNKTKKRRNVESEKAVYELSKIGANLNQLSKQANIGKYNEEKINQATESLINAIKILI